MVAPSSRILQDGNTKTYLQVIVDKMWLHYRHL